MRTAIRFAIAAAALQLAGAAHAYPDKPVQYIIPFAPGGESDITARMQAQVFQAKYRQNMVVINRPGAGGGLVWSTLNGMAADGHTVSGVNLPHIVLQPLEGNVNYKTDDIAPVFFFQYTADSVVVTEASPFKTIQELVSAAKANPEKFTLAGSGTFSANPRGAIPPIPTCRPSASSASTGSTAPIAASRCPSRRRARSRSRSPT